MVDWPKGGRGWVAEALSFHIVLVQGRFFGRWCRIAVSSVDGMRRLSPFYVNNDQEGITKVGWMIIIHISHACISVCDGLQRRAVLLLNEFSRTMSPHSKVSAGALIGVPAETCTAPSLQWQWQWPQQPSHLNSVTFGNLLQNTNLNKICLE